MAKIDVAPILDEGPRDLGSAERVVTVILAVQGVRSIAKLVEKLAEIKGVVAVNAGEVNVTWNRPRLSRAARLLRNHNALRGIGVKLPHEGKTPWTQWAKPNGDGSAGGDNLLDLER